MSQKPIAAFDLDGTFFRRHMLELLFETAFNLELFSKVSRARFNDLTLDYRDRKIRHTDYSKELVVMFDENIRGKPIRDVKSVATRVARENHAWVYTFTRSLFEKVENTHERITITGAVKEVVAEILRYWPFDATYTTEMEIKGGVYTGKNHKLHVNDKARVLQKHLKTSQTSLRGSIAIGDTETDIPMLKSVECPIAFNPNDALAKEAEKQCWPIIIERKDCIYMIRKKKSKRFFIDDAQKAVNAIIAISK